jgi:hypothetical protein
LGRLTAAGVARDDDHSVLLKLLHYRRFVLGDWQVFCGFDRFKNRRSEVDVEGETVGTVIESLRSESLEFVVIVGVVFVVVVVGV